MFYVKISVFKTQQAHAADALKYLSAHLNEYKRRAYNIFPISDVDVGLISPSAGFASPASWFSPCMHPRRTQSLPNSIQESVKCRMNEELPCVPRSSAPLLFKSRGGRRRREHAGCVNCSRFRRRRFTRSAQTLSFLSVIGPLVSAI